MHFVKSYLAILTFLLAFATLAGEGTEANAQDSERSKHAPMSPIIEVDFAGGTLTQYVEALQAAIESSSQEDAFLNVVIAPDVADFPVHAIQFKGVSVDGAMQLISRLGININQIDSQYSDRIYHVYAANTQRTRSHQTKVLSVSKILEEKNQEDLLTAIEIGMNLINDSENKIELKLHKETGLLFAKGTISQLELVRSIVAELTPNASDFRNEQQMKMLDMLRGNKKRD